MSWHCVEFVHPPHLPLTHRSGAQSAFVVQVFWQLPFDAPLQVWAPPQLSFDAQPQVPLEQIPLTQSEFWVHVDGWQVPPQSDPVPQSADEVQALALHFDPLHLPPVPQSDA